MTQSNTGNPSGPIHGSVISAGTVLGMVWSTPTQAGWIPVVDQSPAVAAAADVVGGVLNSAAQIGDYSLVHLQESYPGGDLQVGEKQEFTSRRIAEEYLLRTSSPETIQNSLANDGVIQ